MLLRLREVLYAPFYALFIVGPIAMLIQLWLDSRGGGIGNQESGGRRGPGTTLQVSGN